MCVDYNSAYSSKLPSPNVLPFIFFFSKIKWVSLADHKCVCRSLLNRIIARWLSMRSMNPLDTVSERAAIDIEFGWWEEGCCHGDEGSEGAQQTGQVCVAIKYFLSYTTCDGIGDESGWTDINRWWSGGTLHLLPGSQCCRGRVSEVNNELQSHTGNGGDSKRFLFAQAVGGFKEQIRRKPIRNGGWNGPNPAYAWSSPTGARWLEDATQVQFNWTFVRLCKFRMLYKCSVVYIEDVECPSELEREKDCQAWSGAPKSAGLPKRLIKLRRTAGATTTPTTRPDSSAQWQEK